MALKQIKRDGINNFFIFNRTKTFLKMKKLLIVVTLITIFSSCSKEEIKDERLTGDWYLTDAYCFCGFDPEVDFNDFTLNFDNSKQSVSIGNPPDTYYFIADNGSYNYQLSDNKISFNGVPTDYNYSIEGDVLTLDKIDDPQIADDELTLVFRRK